jgi:hypothetical protein
MCWHAWETQRNVCCGNNGCFTRIAAGAGVGHVLRGSLLLTGGPRGHRVSNRFLTSFVVLMYVTGEIIHYVRQHQQMVSHETNTVITIGTNIKGPIHPKGPHTLSVKLCNLDV